MLCSNYARVICSCFNRQCALQFLESFCENWIFLLENRADAVDSQNSLSFTSLFIISLQITDDMAHLYKLTLFNFHITYLNMQICIKHNMMYMYNAKCIESAKHLYYVGSYRIKCYNRMQCMRARPSNTLQMCFVTVSILLKNGINLNLVQFLLSVH